jgi:ParB family chromosome partitioning protein
MRHDSHYVEELTRSNRSVGRTLPIEKLYPNPDQPRVDIGDLKELSGSIKSNGVLEPILVKPNKIDGTWMIIAGERRWRASKLAGLDEVPCIELDIDEKSIAEIALIENLQRKDLNIWEIADGLAYLGEKFGYTHEEIAVKIGKSRTTVTESLTIAGIPESIREKCRESKIVAKSIILEIARQFDENAMHQFVDGMSGKGLSRKQVRQKARPAGKTSESVKKQEFGIESDKSLFSFKSKENGFALQIKFKDVDAIDDKIILRALKVAFDAVKNKA